METNFKDSELLKEEIAMLPIGSIVYLNEGTNKLMIVSRGAILEEEETPILFDYAGCFYPQGLDIENLFYFNQENIDEVVFEGYSDKKSWTSGKRKIKINTKRLTSRNPFNNFIIYYLCYQYLEI